MTVLASEQMNKTYQYEPSRYFDDFHLAGFTYYDGIDVIQELKIGQKVSLVREGDNPYDPNAVAIYYQDTKLGYVPADHNSLLSKFLFFGHGEIFEAKIQRLDLEAHPEQQIRIIVRMADLRKDNL